MEKVGIFYVHLEYILAIWYILWPLGALVATWNIFPVLVYCVKKNLATLFDLTTQTETIPLDNTPMASSVNITIQFR
jgi:hypothetical protein